MEIKRKRKSASSIVVLIVIILLVLGGITLIFYPFITSIPSLFQRSSHIASWQSNTSTSMQAVPETTIKPEDSGLSTQSTINGQETQPQNSTSSTSAAVSNSENIKYSASDIFPAKLTIPKINVEWITNEGSDVPDLKKGPGHIPQTPLPGEPGRCTLSGHRTTYGAPFNRIDELK